VKVVYCGGCNPHIDRTAVAAELPADDPEVDPQATVHLSGCPRACASDHLLVSDDAGTVVDTPATYREQLLKSHGRKSGFWALVR